MIKYLLAAIALAGVAAVLMLMVTKSAPRPDKPDLASVRQQIVDAWKATRSVKANMEVAVEGPAAMRQTGTYEMKSDGDRRLVRVELNMVQPAGGHKITSISDGQYSWVLSEQGGQISARKSPLDASMTMDPVQFFAQMEEHGTMELLPDEEIDGRTAAVIRVVPKGATLAEGYVTYYLAKDCGLIVRMIAVEAESGNAPRAGLSDIQLNVDLPSERFQFSAPPGVTVEEVTLGS